MRLKKHTAPATGRKAIKGSVLTALRRGQVIAAKWPRPRGPSRTPADLWWRATWGTAAQMSARPHGLDQAFAEAWSRDTRLVPRDMLTLAALGQLFEIELADGQILESLLTVTGNPQQILDLVTDVPGSLLFRTSVGWVGVPPGLPGQVLEYISTDEARWAPQAGAGGGTLGYGGCGGSANNDTSLQSWKGTRFRPMVDMTIHACAANIQVVAGAAYALEIWEVTSNQITTILTPSTPFTPTNSGFSARYQPLVAPIQLTAYTNYAIMWGRTDAGSSFQLNMSEAATRNGIGVPTIYDQLLYRIKKERPVVGDALDTSGQGAFHQVVWSFT